MSDKCVRIFKRTLAAAVAVLVFTGTVNCLAAGIDKSRTGGWIVVGSSQDSPPTEPPTDPPTDPPTEPPAPPTEGTPETAAPPTEQQTPPTEAPVQDNPATAVQGNPASNNNRTTRAPTTTKKPATTAANRQEGVTVAVSFNLNGGAGDYETILAPTKAHLYVPANPVREGYKFMGWFSDPELNNKWDFEGTELTADVTLYAKWVPLVYYTVSVDTGITGGVVTVNLSSATEGDQIEITVTPDDGMRVVKNSLTVNGERQKKLVFEMPACDVFISAQFEEVGTGLSSSSSKKIFVVAGAVLLIVITLAIYFLLMRRRDPNEDEPDWQDDTIVLTGVTTKDGKIVTPSAESTQSEALADSEE